MSPVHVGELTTHVESAGAPDASGGGDRGEQQPWVRLERARRDYIELAELRARTSAEGFDD